MRRSSLPRARRGGGRVPRGAALRSRRGEPPRLVDTSGVGPLASSPRCQGSGSPCDGQAALMRLGRPSTLLLHREPVRTGEPWYGLGCRMREIPAQRYCVGCNDTVRTHVRRSHNPKVVGSNPTPASIAGSKAQVADLGFLRSRSVPPVHGDRLPVVYRAIFYTDFYTAVWETPCFRAWLPRLHPLIAIQVQTNCRRHLVQPSAEIRVR